MSGLNKPKTWSLFVAGMTVVFTSGVSPASADDVAHDEIGHYTVTPEYYVWEHRPVFGFGGGCYPYTAVDGDGNTSGGLSPTGDANGECTSTTEGTLYIHSVENVDSNIVSGPSRIAMYMLYFPKDQGEYWNPIDGAWAHRHDFEDVVIFFDDNEDIIKVAASAHGDYSSVTGDQSEYFTSDGRPQIMYEMGEVLTSTTNSFFLVENVSNTISPPYTVDWDYANSVFKDAFEEKDWGDATPSIIDDNFWDKVKEAWAS